MGGDWLVAEVGASKDGDFGAVEEARRREPALQRACRECVRSFLHRLQPRGEINLRRYTRVLCTSSLTRIIVVVVAVPATDEEVVFVGVLKRLRVRAEHVSLW